MRKFLNLVVQDDLPVLTPPSENESASEKLATEDDANEHEPHPPAASNATTDADNVKHELERALRIADEPKALDQPIHQPDPHTVNSDVSYSSKQKSEQQCSKPVMAMTSEASSETNAPCDEETDNVTFRSVHQNASYRDIAAEPVITSDSSLQVKKDAKEDSHPTASQNRQKRRSRPMVRELLSRSDDRLRYAARVLSSFASGGVNQTSTSPDATLRETQEVVGALREIAETMVWADQHEPSLWDTFMECSIMPLLLRCLRATVVSHERTQEDAAEVFSNPSEGDVDANATVQTSLQSENKYHLQNGTSFAGVTRKVLPNSTDRQGERKVLSSAESTAISAPLHTRDAVLRSRHSTATMGPAEVPDNSAIDEVSEKIALEIQSQVLQSLSIMIQSIFRQHSLLCLFSSNHINEILSFDFRFEDDEVLGYFMSAAKTIALKLDPALLQLFFDPSLRTFPLYNTVVRFFNHREQMVRIAVRNVTLTIYSLEDPEVLAFAARDDSMYLAKTVELLAKLCGSVARAFELLMDDGREVRRTRSRTGIFRQKVRVSEVTVKLEEIENLFGYLGDMSLISKGTLQPLVIQLLSGKLFAPFFRPIASRASPKAVQIQNRWRVTNMTTETDTPALPVFDAAARCLLLAYILEISRTSCLGYALTHELSRGTSEFEGRSVLHALKAMASDITGTERVSFVSLCAIEAFMLCDATTIEVMRSFKYDFFDRNTAESPRALGCSTGYVANGEYHVEGEYRKSLDEPLLMTLSAFDAPLTPSNSLPPTPSYVPPSPNDSATPPNKDLTRVTSATSLSTDELTLHESNESGGFLMTSQRGEASLREVLLSVILVVRRLEVRTLRILHAICRLLVAVGSKTDSFKGCVDMSKNILDEIAGVMQSFLRNKRTTIVSIERMFDNFRSVAEREFSKDTIILSLDDIFSPDALPKIAGDLPKGAGKRRRGRKDNAAPPTEREDAVVLFVMLQAYEQARERHNEVETVPKTQTLNCSKISLSSEVQEILMKCSADESYLDKREALENVATTVLRHGDVN